MHAVGSPERDPNESQNLDASISENKFPLNARATQVAVTAAQLRIVRGIERTKEWTVRWPSCGEVARTMGLAQATVANHVKRLRRIGVLAMSTTRIVRQPTGVFVRRPGGGCEA